MKNLQLYFTALLVVIFLSNGITTLKAQSGNNCIPNRNPADWISQTHFTEGPNRGLIGSVQYEARIVGSNTEVSIDWSTLVNASDGLSEESVKAILEYDLALALSGCGAGTQAPFTTTVSFYYKTPCFYEKHSVMKLKHGNAGLCCDDPNKTFNHLFYNNSWWEIIKTKEPCGTFQCCKRVYTINCALDGGWYKATVDPTIVKSVITGCSTPSGLPNCNGIPNIPPIPPPNCSATCD